MLIIVQPSILRVFPSSTAKCSFERSSSSLPRKYSRSPCLNLMRFRDCVFTDSSFHKPLPWPLHPGRPLRSPRFRLVTRRGGSGGDEGRGLLWPPALGCLLWHRIAYPRRGGPQGPPPPLLLPPPP